MADSGENAAVSLDALNPKQRAKEFKATVKEIKSKDIAVKSAAITKALQDERYFIEGGCLLPMINSAVPKKKSLDTCHLAHEQLLQFLRTSSDEYRAAVVSAIRLILTTEGSVVAIKVLSDAVVFREEIKKPKKKPKKGEPPYVPPPENVNFIIARRGALKCLYYIALALYVQPDTDSDLQQAVAKIENLAVNLSELLVSLSADFGSDDMTVREDALQDGVYAFHALVFALKHSTDASKAFCISPLLPLLAEISKLPVFSLYCVQILEILSQHKEGITVLQESPQQELLVELLNTATKVGLKAEGGSHAAETATPAKKEKPKKGAPVEEEFADPSESLDKIAVDPRRAALACIKLISKVFYAIAAQEPPAVIPIEESTVEQITELSSEALLDPVTYSLLRDPLEAPLDVPLHDAVDEMCIVVGQLALVSPVVRIALCRCGAPYALLSVLRNSDDIITGKSARAPPPAAGKGAKNAPPPEPEPELDEEELAKQRKHIISLRQVAEKAVLNLVTQGLESPLDDIEAGLVGFGGNDGDGNNAEDEQQQQQGIDSSSNRENTPVRWMSCFSRQSDLNAFDFTANPAVTASSNTNLSEQLIDIVGVADDAELSDRGVRILAAILHGHRHPVQLADSKGLCDSLVTPLSNAIHERCLTVVDQAIAAELERRTKAAALAAADTTEQYGADATADAAEDIVAMDDEANAAVAEENEELEAIALQRQLEAELSQSGAAASASAVDADAEVPLSNDAITAEAEAGSGESTGGGAASSTDILIPSASESLYLGLSVLELLLMASPNAINAFATTERIEALANLLRSLGPTNSKAFAGADEYNVVLHDPRRHGWQKTSTDPYCDTVLMRPLICDVLTLIAAANKKYRVYEDTEDGAAEAGSKLPPPPTEPVPPSQSPCEEASLITCALAADACCGVLLSQATFQWTTENLTVAPAAVPAGKDSSVLVQDVQDAALRLLEAIASCGARGIAGAVQGIANTGFAYFATPVDAMNTAENDDAADGIGATIELSTCCAMQSFGVFITSDSAAAPTDLLQLVPEGYEWVRPLFFDEVFPASTPSAAAAAAGDDDDEGNEPHQVQDVPKPLLTAFDELPHAPQLWPWIVFCASFMPTLSNPATAASSARITVDALIAATRLSVLEDNSQAVVTDIVSATLLSIGGGVALSGLLGNFGNTDKDDLEGNEAMREYLAFLFSRGHSRQEFWTAWEIDHREEIPIDPKTGKPVVKKDDKKGAKDPKADKKGGKNAVLDAPPSIVAELVLNLESTEEFPDPNHGPNAAFWTQLLEVSANDLHEHCKGSPLLTSLIQGSLGGLAELIVDHGVNLDQRTASGLTPVMYSLVLGDAAVTTKLVDAGADCNLLDHADNPTIVYAMMSLSNEQLQQHFSTHFNPPTSDQGDTLEASSHRLYGRPTLLPILLTSGVDVNVRDPVGFSPLMQGLGLGELDVSIGGYAVRIQNESYHNPTAYPIAETHSTVDMLLSAECDVNACSFSGVVPLHVAAARGDAELLQVLYDHKAIPNALDAEGFFSVHYLCACCPESAPACFDLLMKYSANLPLERMQYDDFRTGHSEEAKTAEDMSRYMKNVFEESLLPSVICKRRLQPSQLTCLLTDHQMNALQLCFAAPVLLADDVRLKPFFTGDKDARMDLALHILGFVKNVSEACEAELLSFIDPNGLSVLHAASLLFQGQTPQMFLTDREKRAKRVRKFVSKEAQLLDIIFSSRDAVGGDVSDLLENMCAHELPQFSLKHWNPMFPAIAWDNPFLAQTLLDRGYSVSGDTQLAHFLAKHCPTASSELCTIIINDACANSSDHKALLNEPVRIESAVFSASEASDRARPLHLAVRSQNYNAVRALVDCHKVELNMIDELKSGRTAFHEACQSGDLELVRTFSGGSDRLDLLISSSGDGVPRQQDATASASEEAKASYTAEGTAHDTNTATTAAAATSAEPGLVASSPLETVIVSRDVDILMELIAMRKNDVIQQLLQPPTIPSSSSSTGGARDGEEAGANSDGKQDTLLLAVENEYLELAARLGFNVPETGADYHQSTRSRSISVDDAEVVVAATDAVVAVPAEQEEEPLASGDGNLAPTDAAVADADVGEATELELVTELTALALNTSAESGGVTNNNNAIESEGEVEVDQLVIEETTIEQANIGGKASDSRTRDLAAFRSLGAVLQLLLETVNSNGIVTASNHAHEIFFRGELIEEGA